VADGQIGFVQARHEEMAAFMASAYAKFSREFGVCIATSGPGASHLVTGLYDALLITAAKYWRSWRDPNESGMIEGAARQVLETILPGKE